MMDVCPCRFYFIEPNYRIVSILQIYGSAGPCRAVCSRLSSPALLIEGFDVDVASDDDLVDVSRKGSLKFGLNAGSARLAAGDCGEEAVRVWDPVKEQCMWIGPVVACRVIPTTTKMWKSVNHNDFVDFGRNGRVYIAEVCEQAAADMSCSGLLWRHKAFIVSANTCSSHEAIRRWEPVLSADCDRDVFIWVS